MFGKISSSLGKIILMKKVMINNIFKETNLYYGQHPILEILNKNNGSTQIEIADKLGVSAASIALSTKRMEKNGLLCKKIDEKNLRCKKLFITDKGIASLEKIHKEIKKIDDKMFNGFSKDEINNFNFFLDKIMKNVLEDGEFDLKVENIIKTMNINMEE